MFYALITFIRWIFENLWKGAFFLFSHSAKGALDERTAERDPIIQFSHWYKDASKTHLVFPDAVVLATATRGGKPSARMMLLKEFGERGFVVYTNYGSRKAVELKDNSKAALVFYWAELARQVRIEGTMEQIPLEESDRYFETRPRDSQIGAWASAQSEAIDSREGLDRRYEEFQRRFSGKPVPRPPHWGGYRLTPHRIEFWQGRVARLHDRIVYERKQEGPWQITRLSP